MAENEKNGPEDADQPKPAAAEGAPGKAAKADKGEAKGKGDKGKAGAKGDKGKGGKGGKVAKAPSGPAVAYKRDQPPRLRRIYEEEVREKLRAEFDYKNPMQIPRLVKISLNMGLGKATQNPKIMDNAVEEMRAISGRTPVVTLAKKDIATFKLRRGVKIGVMVTLRREAMWEFLDRLLNVALPRVRDFRGVSGKSFDGRGNYTLGLKEQLVFPEIDYDKVDKVRGMDIVICTTAKTDAEAKALLKGFDMPFNN